jgi:hypothetical protein
MDKGRHVKGAEQAAWTRNLVARYDAGESIRNLVTASGRSYRNIRDLLIAGGAAIRTRSGRPRRRTNRSTPPAQERAPNTQQRHGASNVDQQGGRGPYRL